jgi:hypothetical protein
MTINIAEKAFKMVAFVMVPHQVMFTILQITMSLRMRTLVTVIDVIIPQPRSPTKCLWIEKSIKEGQGPQIRTVEAS